MYVPESAGFCSDPVDLPRAVRRGLGGVEHDVPGTSAAVPGLERRLHLRTIRVAPLALEGGGLRAQ